VHYLGRLLIEPVAEVTLLMNKSEGLSVLHEIQNHLGESILMEDVRLDCTPMMQHESDGAYEIRIKCQLSSQSRQILQSISEKHKLLMKEEKGILVIY
jgi:hypothetical protein